MEKHDFSKKIVPGRRHAGSASFEVLVRRIGQGSEEAVWEILDRYSTNILRVVRRYLSPTLRSKVDSVDIVQSVWKSLLRKGDAFDNITSAEQFVGYIAGVARNKVLENHRHFTQRACADISREVSYDAPQRAGGAHGPDDLLDRRAENPCETYQAREKWETALQSVGARGERIVQLRLQGMTHAEIADETGMTVAMVRRTLAALLASICS